MSKPSDSPKAKSGTPWTILAVLVVLAAAAAGIYYGFFKDGPPGETAGPSDGTTAGIATGGDTTGGVATTGTGTEGALVGGGKVGDIKAFLDELLPIEERAKVSYEIDGNSLKNVSIVDEVSGDKITIRQVDFLALDTENKPPRFVDIRLDDYEMAVPAGQLPGGVEKIKADIRYAYEHDPETKILKVPAFAADLDGLGQIALRGEFTDVSDLGSGGGDDTMAAVAGGKIKSFSLVVADQQMFKMALEGMAKDQGVEVDAFKGQATAMLAALETQLTGDIEKQILAAAKTVLSKTEGVTLTITANPTEPFPLAGFAAIGMGQNGMPDLSALAPLNLKIEAK